MTQLFLKHVALQQFRSFAALNVGIPAEPGVLIVHGSNGLGKSSLFDALEWALSDQIDHFRDANGVNKPGAYLCRWREGETGPTSAAMTFSDDSTIVRSLLSAKSNKSQLTGSVPDVTTFLRAPAWQQRISELQRYLLLTHFLGQSTLSRLTHRKSTERFDILKEAAQSTAVEAISNALHGHGNSSAVRAYARQIEALERDAKDLGDLLEQEALLWAEAQIAGAIDEADALAEAGRIAAQLTQAQLESKNAPSSLGVEVGSAIELLQAMADQIERDCLVAEEQLEDARRLYAERQRVLANVVEINAERTAMQTRLHGLTGELEQARKLQGELRAKAATYHEAVTHAATAVSRLQDLRDARTLVFKLASDQLHNAAMRAAAEQDKVAAEQNVTLAERRRQVLQRLDGEIVRCDEEIDRSSDRLSLVNQAIACDDRVRDLSNALSRLEVGNPDIDQAVLRAEKAAGAAADGVDVQATVVDGLRNTVNTMSNAISSIATHLPVDACDCPLCATHFDSASALRVQVSTAAQRLAPALVAHEEALKALSIARNARVIELQQLRDEQSAIRSARAALDAERVQRSRLLARLDEGSGFESSALATRRARLTNSIAVLNSTRQRKLRWQTHSALRAKTSNVDYSRAVRARDAAQRTLDAAIRTSTDLATALDHAKLDEASANATVGADREISPTQLPILLEEAEATWRQLREGATAASAALGGSDAVVSTLDGEHAGLRARLMEMDSRKTDLDRTQHRISDDWLSLQRFGAAPDLAPVQAVERRLNGARLKVKDATGQIARIREGHLAWARQRSHRAVIERIGETVDWPPNGTREELLASAISLRSQKEADAEAIREVKEIARAASADINDELEGFNSEYIKPLGFLMSRINQAILCDPRVGIDLHVKKKKIEQSAVKGAEVPKAVGEIDPVLVHSEGQMAALAVSMLCAASLTFPWSRWKALILDDPLQHNDSIHAAAFADLMGNLVRAEGYQILLSTHDVAQAEFLQRKFRSRQIPCTRLDLLGLGKNGVEWSVQPSHSIGSWAGVA
ncbi:AAA family ATPase [Variovorax saccharolyticus]|uniref:AAA family ATPase n=1 Tax=Variovorax saccharolyticus TaxID=3053516 RepID=UPI002578F6EE|nr:AAA family ATPase [Variovorax sp. J31P216]MDM0030076.1 AAA family ATPase [Variovorax sp. J31P216]